MTRQVRLCCAWSVLFFFLFTLFSPDDALCSDFFDDYMKTPLIITGITFGVALLIVLVVGTVRDLKRDRGDEDEDDDVWSQSPVLKTLGYRHVDYSLFGRSPTHPEGLTDEGLAGRQEIEAFLDGKVDKVRFESPYGLVGPGPRPYRLGGVPTEFSLSHPAAGREGKPPPFSLYRSCRIEGETGRTPGTT